MASRQDRMQQRLRGAQRHQVEDAGFAFVLSGLDLGLDLGLGANPDDVPPANETAWPQPDIAVQHPQPPEPSQQPEQSEQSSAIALEPPSEISVPSPHPVTDLPEASLENVPSPVIERVRQSVSDTVPAVEPPSSDGPSLSAQKSIAPNISSRRTSPRLSRRSPKVVDNEEAVPGTDGMDGAEGETQPMEEVDNTEIEASIATESPMPNGALHDTSTKTGTSMEEINEVQESPEDLPGSGTRRTVRVPSSTSSSRLLKEALVSIDNEEDVLSSSPVARMVKRNAALGRTSWRSRSSGSNDRAGEGAITEIPESNEHEASSLQASSAEITTEVEAEFGESMVQVEEPVENHSQLETDRSSPPPNPQPNGTDPEEAEEAEAISPQRLARTFGRKRRRQSPAPPPESVLVAEEQVAEPEGRGGKRRRKKASIPEPPPQTRRLRANRAQQASVPEQLPSPTGEPHTDTAQQMEMETEPEPAVEEVEEVEESRPARTARSIEPEPAREQPREDRPREKQPTPAKRGARAQPRQAPAANAKEKRRAGAKVVGPRTKPAPVRPRAKKADKGDTIPITVQRFSRRHRPDENNPDAIDILSADIPFTQRRTPNTIDVLTQVCHETIDSVLEKNAAKLHEVQTAAERKEIRIKLRAVEAFREQMAHSLLEHTIHLEKLYSLRQGVKHSLKTRDQLQDDVIRMRRERDEIKMQIEAVQARHRVEEQEARRRLDISTAMNDIDLAVEKGKAAPELTTSAEQKTAGLASLEAQMARLAGHVSSSAGGGGALKAVKDFNAFLERAALALEGGGKGKAVVA